ncbi:epoxyqueuosine reductase [Candidatus Woesearchaeota archaeon]|nr:epoxyqueuosine reductase [Candidatus Woesearchaeota archaeon]
MDNNIKKHIESYVLDYNNFKKTKTSWKKPLVAFADANDPLFKELKKIISPSHCLPTELLSDAKSVIAYFIPFVESIPKSNIHGRNCSIEWSYAYIETNQLIIDLNKSLEKFFTEKGFSCKVTPPTHNFDEEKLISDWSHKHIAFIAGLGKFGVHHLLITKKGCCGRLGSIVTNAKLVPTKRPEKEFCLYKSKGICLECVKKCVNQSLKEQTYNRHKCYEMCLENDSLYSELGTTDICGKCSTIVPCSFNNPTK